MTTFAYTIPEGAIEKPQDFSVEERTVQARRIGPGLIVHARIASLRWNVTHEPSGRVIAVRNTEAEAEALSRELLATGIDFASATSAKALCRAWRAAGVPKPKDQE